MLALFALFKTLGIWWRVGIVIGITLVFVAAIWSVYHSIYKTGYSDAEGKLKPQITKLQVDLSLRTKDLEEAIRVNGVFKSTLDELAARVRDQNLMVSSLQANAIEAQNQAKAAMARVAANQQRYSAEIARLKSIVNGPPMTEGDSDEADAILRTLLRDRMSVGAGPAPPDGRRGAQGGGDQSAGAAAVHQQGRFAGRSAAYVLGFEEGEQGAGGSGSGTRLAVAR